MNETKWIMGDCIQEMQSLPDNSIDIVVTSPPYNIGVDYNEYDDKTMTTVQYKEWTARWMDQVYRVLNVGSSFFLNVSGSRSRPDIPLHVYEVARSRGFVLQNEIAWVKSIYINPDDYADSVAQALQKNITSEEIGDVLGATLKAVSECIADDTDRESLRRIARQLYDRSLNGRKVDQVVRRLVGEVSQIIKSDRSDIPFPEGVEKYTDPKIWEYHRRQRGHTFGHVKPIQSDYFLNGTHEFIYHFAKPAGWVTNRKGEESPAAGSYRKIRRNDPGVGVPFVHPSNYCRWKGVAQGKAAKQRATVAADTSLSDGEKAKEFARIDAWEKRIREREQRLNKCGGNTWHIPYDTIQRTFEERGGHEATFPIGLPERCIRLHGIEDGMTVLDPFGGIGTTALACKKIDEQSKNTVSITCILIEQDSYYLETGRKLYNETSFKPKQIQGRLPIFDGEEAGEPHPPALPFGDDEPSGGNDEV